MRGERAGGASSWFLCWHAMLLDRSPSSPPACLCSAMQPGLLRGLASPAENAAFDADFKEVTKELYWCCASAWNASISSFVYEMPTPFAALGALGGWLGGVCGGCLLVRVRIWLW